MSKLAIGFITYNEMTAKYLPLFLSSLKNQTYNSFKIYVADNSDDSDNENCSILDNHQYLNYQWMEGNIGFAKAYNILIDKAIRAGSEYILVINPDIILEPDAIEKMIEVLESDEMVASVSPKIYRWDFKNNKKLNVIDTMGLKEIAPLRFVDVAQGEIDAGQNRNIDIDGGSGAATVYRLDALQKVKDKYGYFDERMFMYKEDCELAYRLKDAGFKTETARNAILYHDRTVSAGGRYIWDIIRNRKNKSRKVNIWSFRNQQIMFSKHWKKQSLVRKFKILLYQSKLFSYVFFFEPYLLKDYFAKRKRG